MTLKYLRDNSRWYKILNRHPESVDALIKEMKERYEVRFSDKFNRVATGINLLGALLGDENN